MARGQRLMDSPAPLLTDGNQCVHCGFCLPACPTYPVLGTELDGPRGRLQLMAALGDGSLAPQPSAIRHLDLCLGCRACETECPSGVAYGARLQESRAALHGTGARPAAERWLEAAVLAGVASPAWLQRAVLGIATLGARLVPTAWLPARLRPGAVLLSAAHDRTMSDLPASGNGRPASLSRSQPAKVAAFTPRHSSGAPSGGAPDRPPRRVGLVLGCLARVLFAPVNAATARLCAAAGCDVVAPPEQRCCGALHAHSGDLDGARALARRMIEDFERQGALDAIVVNAAGCGSHLKELRVLFADDPEWAPRAAAFSARVRDALEWLAEIGPPTPRRPIEATACYHDACHLAHGQGIRQQPRALLGALPGLRVVPLPDSERCCGSAGLFNLAHPAVADALRDDKLAAVASTGAHVVTAANPGCLLQMQAGARAAGLPLTVVHPLELLDAACRPDD